LREFTSPVILLIFPTYGQKKHLPPSSRRAPSSPPFRKRWSWLAERPLLTFELFSPPPPKKEVPFPQATVPFSCPRTSRQARFSNPLSPRPFSLGFPTPPSGDNPTQVFPFRFPARLPAVLYQAFFPFPPNPIGDRGNVFSYGGYSPRSTTKPPSLGCFRQLYVPSVPPLSRSLLPSSNEKHFPQIIASRVGSERAFPPSQSGWDTVFVKGLFEPFPFD